MADADALDDDHTTFIQFEGMPVLSRAAVQLHTFGIVNSIQDGRPGFVSDDYLNAIAAETTTTVLELEAAGMWERRDGGYLVVADEMLKIAIDFNEKRVSGIERAAASKLRHLVINLDRAVLGGGCGLGRGPRLGRLRMGSGLWRK
jgi:hypothetical protein